jgi:hypothetical protein
LANGRYEAKKAYTSGEVAALLEISVKTAKVWIDNWILPGYRLIPHPKSKERAPRPAAGEWGSNPASILHARMAYGERRVLHQVLMRFLDQHRPDFDFVRAKLAHQNHPCVEQWKVRRRKKLAGATAGGSASSPAESGSPDHDGAPGEPWKCSTIPLG